jgi:long-chain acyl-CoA synthetase
MSLLSDLVNGVLHLDPTADVIDYQDHWFLWGDLAGAVDAVQKCLTRLQLGQGARIGIMVRNRPDSLAGILTAVAQDACIVSINPLLPNERLLSDLESLRLPVVVGEASDLGLPGALDVIRSAGSAVIQLDPILQGAHLMPGFTQVTGSDVRRHDYDVIIEMLTSGTTGAPKRVPLRRKAFERSMISAMSYEKGRKPDDPPQLRSGIQLLTNPMTHIGGMWHALSTILGGRRICMVEKFSVGAWRSAVVRHRPKIAGAVPAGLRMILDANLPKEDLASLVALRSGAAPLDPSVVDEFLRRYDLPVLQNYGATEFSGAVAGWSLPAFRSHYKQKRGSVGRFQPGIEGRVVDADTGAELPRGEEGVLEMKALQFSIGDNWLRTTDRAVIDADGYLYICGRTDNAINRGGFKVHPEHVATVLERHPAVREAVVVGVADRRLGAVPVAAIMLKSGSVEPTEAELTAFAKQELLPYQVPTQFRIFDDVPRTASMKPALQQVRALFESDEDTKGATVSSGSKS